MPRRISRLVWWTAYVLTQTVHFLRYRITVIGSLEPPRGGQLVLSKHGYSFEIPYVGLVYRFRARGYPYFQMGSFVGYRVFGVLGPLFRSLGGLAVMRPKEVRRLSRLKGWDRERALERMREVNEAAELTRRAIFREGRALVVYPEGTRDPEAVRPLVSTVELESALAVEAEGHPVTVLPVVLSYGRKKWPRRRMLIDLLPPLPLEGRDATAILEEVAALFARRWVPPEEVDAGRVPAAASRSTESEVR